MSLRICSVMGIGLAASGDMYLVKMLTASLSIPRNEKNQYIKETENSIQRMKDKSDSIHSKHLYHIQRPSSQTYISVLIHISAMARVTHFPFFLTQISKPNQTSQ